MASGFQWTRPMPAALPRRRYLQGLGTLALPLQVPELLLLQLALQGTPLPLLTLQLLKRGLQLVLLTAQHGSAWRRQRTL